jgi:hypothetical protein
VIVGSPDELAEQLRNVATTLNVGQMMLLLQFGNMSHELALHNTELFAKKVAPQLSDLFDDEGENRGGPKPMKVSDRATPRAVVV